MMFGLSDTETKIRAFIRERFYGDPANAFAHYAPSGSMDAPGVAWFLREAGVGPAVYRNLLARLAMDRLDADRDGGITLAEFKAGFPTEE
jgi:hypothetical protein